MTMQVDWLRGCATALVTPFTKDGAVDEERLRALIEYQIEGGVKILVPCGTTGESATMTDEEDQRVIKLTVDAARGRAHVIAGAGSNSTAAAIASSRIARDLGADALLQLRISPPRQRYDWRARSRISSRLKKPQGIWRRLWKFCGLGPKDFASCPATTRSHLLCLRWVLKG